MVHPSGGSRYLGRPQQRQNPTKGSTSLIYDENNLRRPPATLLGGRPTSKATASFRSDTVDPNDDGSGGVPPRFQLRLRGARGRKRTACFFGAPVEMAEAIAERANRKCRYIMIARKDVFQSRAQLTALKQHVLRTSAWTSWCCLDTDRWDPVWIPPCFP